MFATRADQSLVGVIREVPPKLSFFRVKLTLPQCLDTGLDYPFSPESSDPKIPIAFGDTLIQLLDSLVDPIVPFSSQARCIQVTSRDEAFEVRSTLTSESDFNERSRCLTSSYLQLSTSVPLPSSPCSQVPTLCHRSGYLSQRSCIILPNARLNL